MSVTSQPFVSPTVGLPLTISTDGRRTWIVDMQGNPYARFSPRVSFVRASLTTQPALLESTPNATADYAAFEAQVLTSLGNTVPAGFQPTFTQVTNSPPPVAPTAVASKPVPKLDSAP